MGRKEMEEGRHGEEAEWEGKRGRKGEMGRRQNGKEREGGRETWGGGRMGRKEREEGRHGEEAEWEGKRGRKGDMGRRQNGKEREGGRETWGGGRMGRKERKGEMGREKCGREDGMKGRKGIEQGREMEGRGSGEECIDRKENGVRGRGEMGEGEGRFRKKIALTHFLLENRQHAFQLDSSILVVSDL